MPGPLQDKSVVLGVTGSVAAYKAVDLASKLTQEGALVDALLTRGATEFVTPLAFRSITHRPVLREMFDPESEQPMEHLELAERADIVVVAPATAHAIAKLALGLADDMVTTTILATEAPVLVAPAMDGHMYENPVTQENLDRLRRRGVTIAGPAQGRLASGKHGWGRFLETPELMGHIKLVLGRAGDLAGRSIVVSAGPTQEPIDAVRVVTSRSSGRMGFAVAEAARDRGARVVLVTGPSALANPVGVEVVRVDTALRMRDAVRRASAAADVLVMAAAVSDYRPATTAPHKLKKGEETWSVEMVMNPDILGETPRRLVKVGFAAESERLEEHAGQKLRAKGLDLIVANDITDASSGFGSDTNQVLLVGRRGAAEALPLMSKYEVAWRVLDRVSAILQKRR